MAMIGIGLPTQACVQEAFSTQSLMGLGLLDGLDGFESGCGCGALGATEYSDTGSGEGSRRIQPYPASGASGVCDDTSLWAVRSAGGKCWNYCTMDISQQHEVDAAACAVGASTITGKVTPKTMDVNMLLVGGIALAALLLSRQ